jgi:hypothetical protein
MAPDSRERAVRPDELTLRAEIALPQYKLHQLAHLDKMDWLCCWKIHDDFGHKSNQRRTSAATFATGHGRKLWRAYPGFSRSSRKHSFERRLGQKLFGCTLIVGEFVMLDGEIQCSPVSAGLAP